MEEDFPNIEENQVRTFLALLCGDCYWQAGHCEVLLGTLSYLRVLGGISGYFQVLLGTLRHYQSPRSHQVVQTHTSSTRAHGSTGQCCRQTTERPSRNCKAGRAWLQFHHVLCLMNPIVWPAWPSTLQIDFYLKHCHPLYNISLFQMGWDGMGKTSGYWCRHRSKEC